MPKQLQLPIAGPTLTCPRCRVRLIAVGEPVVVGDATNYDYTCLQCGARGVLSYGETQTATGRRETD